VELVAEIFDNRVGDLRGRFMQAIHLIAHHLQHVVGVDALVARQRQLNHHRSVDLALLNANHTMRFGTLGPSKLGAHGIQQTNSQTQGTHTNAQQIRIHGHRLSNTRHKPVDARQHNDWQSHLGGPTGLALLGTGMQP
jgi:hypothetical protein